MDYVNNSVDNVDNLKNIGIALNIKFPKDDAFGNKKYCKNMEFKDSV